MYQEKKKISISIDELIWEEFGKKTKNKSLNIELLLIEFLKEEGVDTKDIIL
jgi:hypothetical protein